MNRSAEQIQLIVVGGVYFFVLMLLICSLQLLIKMARIQMKPRQKYVKPDPLFKSYDAQQNWNWDWVMVFRVYGPDSYVSDYQRHYSLRLIVKMRIERGYRDEFGKYKWYPRRDGWKLASEGDEGGEKLEKTFNNAIVDTEGQSGYAFNEHIYGKYDKRGDLQSPSVYVTYPASNSIFRSVDRLKLMMGIMEGDIKQEGCSLILKELITRGACLAIYPLHDDDALQTIQDRTWLFYAGALGIVTYALEIVPSPFAVWSTTFCGIFMSMWSTVFLEHWKSTQARAKMTWGMTGFEDTEQDRTEFEGREIHSPVTGMPEAYFPDSEKARRIACSYLQVILCMVYVSAVNAGVFYTYAYVSRWPVQGLLDFNAFFSGGASRSRRSSRTSCWR
ncbi:intracellular chloride channel [Aureococcus anophagefferens]|nr:intracellular chloride channel [Aureococcus anophagefferens]